MHAADISNPLYRAVVENTFAADASLDPGRFVSCLTPDATFQLGGNPPVDGRDAIRDMLTGLFSSFERVRHTLRQAYELPAVLIYEADVEYTFKNGSSRTVPYANVLRFEGHLVRSYRIYLDMASGAG